MLSQYDIFCKSGTSYYNSAISGKRAVRAHIQNSKLVSNKKELLLVALYLEMLTNQKPVLTRARHSISEFHLRKGLPIGCAVTLRNLNFNNFNMLLGYLDKHYVSSLSIPIEQLYMPIIESISTNSRKTICIDIQFIK